MKEIRPNGMQLFLAQDYQELSRLAACKVLSKTSHNPYLSLLVPTGKTPEGMYRYLRREKNNPFSFATFFNLDEYFVKCGNGYLPYDSRDAVSYRYYMDKYLYTTHCPKEKFFPSWMDAEKEGLYDELIYEEGGIDLCVSAVGEDGHTFGFNFPGTSWDSRTKAIKLPESLRAINFQKTGRKTPHYAVTAGIATGMDSKEILVLVSGKHKAEVLANIVYSEPSEAIPATVLKLHDNCTWLVDKDAASLIE